MWWPLFILGCGSMPPPDPPVAPADPNRCVVAPIPGDLVPLTANNARELEQVGVLCDQLDRGTIVDLEAFGDQLATSGERSGVQVWTPEGGRVRTMTVNDTVHSLHWVDERSMLVLGTGSGDVFGVNLDGQRLWQGDAPHEGAVNALLVRPDAGDVFSGGADGWLIRRSLRDGRVLVRRNLGGALADVAALGDDEVVVCGHDLLTHALDASGLVAGKPWARERETSWALAIRPYANHIAVGATGVTVWEGLLETRYQHDIEGSARSIAYDPTGDLLAVGTWGGQLLLFDANARTTVSTHHPSDSRILAVTFSPDGRYVATAGDQGLIRLWGVRAPRLH